MERLTGQYHEYREWILIQYPMGKHLAQSTWDAWSPYIFKYFSQLEATTRVALVLALLILCYVLIKGTVKYAKFCASLIFGMLQMLLFVALFLAIIFYRSAIGDITMNIVNKLDAIK